MLGISANKRTNTPQLGALRASLVRPDHRRVIFGKHLKPGAPEEYALVIYTQRFRSNAEGDRVRACESGSPERVKKRSEA